MSQQPSWTSWLPRASNTLRGASRLASAGAKYNPGGYGGALSTMGNYAGGAGNAVGVLSGLQQGGVGGYGGAAVNAGQLANRAGAFGGSSGAAGQGLGDAVNALGIYRGIKQGGVGGYGGAAVNAAELGSRLGAFGGASGAIGSAAGYAALPLAAYNFIQNDTASGRTGSDALGGAETGAEAGAMFGPVGMGVGAVIGGAAGALASAFGPGAVDPENKDFEGYTQAYNKALQQGGQGAADKVAQSMQNPYLPLAGYFDLRSGQMKGQNPIYSTYGRKGEQKFTDDMLAQISAAQKSGQIKPGESASQAYSDVVAPWLNKMGTWQDSNKQAMQGALQQMTAQDLAGQAGSNWKAIGGDSPFAHSAALANAPPQAAAPIQVASSPTSSPTAIHPMLRAGGGSVKHHELSAKLRRLYEGAFKDHPRHYEDGGYVDYFTPTAGGYEFNDPQLQDFGDVGTGWSDTSDPWSSINQNTGNDYNVVNAQNDPYGYSGSTNNSMLGQGGGLSGLGSLLGVSSMGDLVKKYGALAPLLSAALGSNKPASAPATPAGYGPIPSIATPTNPRSYTQPNVANWYTYGQGPEQSFFNHNQLPTVPGVSPAGAPQQSANSPNMSIQPIVPHPGVQLAGGGSFDSTQGDDYVPDPGHGDGTSDGIDAKLSGGEYVMDAGTVATLGNGSNEAGARALDQLRARVRKHAGKQLVKGKQFMKAKQPHAYLGGKG